MRNILALLAGGLLCLLVGCAPSAPAAPSTVSASTASPSTPTLSATPTVGAVSTPTRMTSVTITAATAAPSAAASVVPATPSSTRAATPSGSAALAELKYVLLARYPNFFYCDRDLYPVARGDEAELAIARFPEIQKDTASFNVILAHVQLSGASSFSDAQKLTIYRAYKQLNALTLEPAGDGYTFQLRARDPNLSGRYNGYAIEGSISRSGNIVESKRAPALLDCPICLSADTLIDGALGPIAVRELRAGMWVWTRLANGARVLVPVIRVSQTPAPAWHAMVRLRLADGRELLASPGHPTADGRALGDLQVGDVLDGAPIVSVSREPYTAGATFDLLPDGGTGLYWANGILLGSTLK